MKNKKILCLLTACLSSPVGAVDFDISEDVSLTLKGKLHYDAAIIDNGAEKKKGSHIRRAKVSAMAKFGSDVRAKIEYDIDDSTPVVGDAYIEYKGFKNTSIKVGNISHIAGLENSSSASQMPFMERSFIEELLPDSGIGVQASTYDDNWTLSGTFTGDDIESFDELSEKSSAKEVTTARATTVLFKDNDSLLHIGGTLNRTNPKGKKVKFHARTGSKLSDVVASTGKLKNIDNYFTEGLEMAWSQGALLVQGEYIRTQLHNNNHRDNNTIDGWYTSATYALSGKTHKYNKKKGTFNAPKLKEGSSNIELVARMSELDLNSETLTAGVVKSKTIGANYYLNEKTRLMLDYGWTDVELEKTTNIDTIKTLQARIQMSFY